jgi:hypothetical protein
VGPTDPKRKYFRARGLDATDARARELSGRSGRPCPAFRALPTPRRFEPLRRTPTVDRRHPKRHRRTCGSKRRLNRPRQGRDRTDFCPTDVPLNPCCPTSVPPFLTQTDHPRRKNPPRFPGRVCRLTG